MAITSFGNIVSSIFGGTQNPKRVVYMNELNSVIAQVNANVPSVNHVIQITQSGTNKPTSQYVSTGDTDNCKTNCSSVCSACDCQKGCLNEVAFSTNFVWAYNGVGNYTLTATFSSAVYSKGIYNVALFLSPLATYNNSIGVTSSSNSNKTVWTFTFNTYSGSDGALRDGVINGVFADIRVFTN